jgi:NAD(P)-dependent dehydrogenase (short-subunit alcohol dehydrogenase family)
MFNYDTIKTFAESNRFSLIGFATIASFVYFTNRFYFAGGVCRSKRRLEGKTVIITGANTGIGYETALDLAKRGARIILACRDSKRANQAASQIRKLSGNGNVIVELVDLASFDSIREFCKRIDRNEPRLDILINNAGIMACPKWTTKDGFEMQFGVNHLGHFLLTNLLLDKLKSSAPSRIVNVSSRAYESKFNVLL